MAYSDYVTIYNVAKSAGIGSSDDMATACQKIANWINGTFNDVVTSDLYSSGYVSIVRVLDKKVKAGFVWGQVLNSSSSYINDRRFIYYNTTDYSYSNDTTAWADTEYPLANLGLFTCFTGNGYVMDFINLSRTDFRSYPRFISATGISNGVTKQVCIGSNKYYQSGVNYPNWLSISQDKSAPVNGGMVNQSVFLGPRNPGLSNIILTKYTPIAEDIICDGLYKMDGAMPPCKTIFEVNNVKYLSLNYSGYGDSCGLALKL